MHPMLNTAKTAAVKAGRFIVGQSERIDRLNIERKEANDFVSEVDKTVEAELIATLKRAYPDHGFQGEEGTIVNPEADYQWIIDPLDGTTNFLYGIPHYAVSMAVKHRGRLEHGLVYDPQRDELFTASRGGGAQLNNHRIRISNRLSLDNALLSTGIPFRASQMPRMDEYLQVLKALSIGGAGVRRPGAAALDLAWVAAGRFDGFWEYGLQPWDIAAGALLVQEAGGLVGDTNGGNSHMESGDVVAASPKVFKEMLKRMHPIIERYKPVPDSESGL